MNLDIKTITEILMAIRIPFLIGSLVFLNTWQNTQILNIQREISNTNLEKAELERENEELKISILKETSVEKVDKIYSRMEQDKSIKNKVNITTLKLTSKNGDSIETK